MSDAVLSQIEKSIEELPSDEQLLLISRMAERLRKNALNEAEFEAKLEEMAADMQIQAELRRIEEDFAVTELDGLSE
jgi:hypothetical protein